MVEEKLIPKVYEPQQVEEKWYSTWVRNNYFHAETDEGGEPFCIVIPLLMLLVLCIWAMHWITPSRMC